MKGEKTGLPGFDIAILNDNEVQRFYEQIYKLLVDSDEEFFPPLSMRNSTTQSNLTVGEKSEDGILNYFEELKKQKIMVAHENDKLLGFVSDREDYVNSEIGMEELPDIYISTLVVNRDARGKGITGEMYKNLFDVYKNVNVFTRTWSTNFAHIKILSKFDFEVFRVLKDDRAKGVDTVYFKKTKR